MSFDIERVADILVCPACHQEMLTHGETLVDVSPECRRVYQIPDGIPRLLISESEQLPVDQWSAIMQQHGRDPSTGLPPDTDL